MPNCATDTLPPLVSPSPQLSPVVPGGVGGVDHWAARQSALGSISGPEVQYDQPPSGPRV